MKKLTRIKLYDGTFKVYQMSSHLPKAKAALKDGKVASVLA